MLNKAMIVADSGGSGTDWCYVDHFGNKTFFSNRSYHPLHWSEDFILQEKKFWSDKEEMMKAKLHFFGAGCLNQDKASQMKRILEAIGFEEVNVLSDLHAAAFALYKGENGVFGILGTGSVAARIEKGVVLDVTGGLGYILGDEGSGYYFGKLLLRELLNDALPDILAKEIYSILGPKTTIMNEVYGSNSRSFVAGIAKKMNDLTAESLNEIHEVNLNIFIDQLMKRMKSVQHISLVGSYAWHQQKILTDACKKRGISVDLILEKPIADLTEYLLRTTV